MPAVTSRGMNESHVVQVVDFIDKVLMNIDNTDVVNATKEEVKQFMQQFQLYPEIA